MTWQELERWPVVADPTEAEVGRIRRHAVALGGAALQLPHRDRSTAYKIKGAGGAVSPVRYALVSCERVAQFTVPLEEQIWQREVGIDIAPARTAPTKWQKQANDVRLCAVDDSAHLWPRFQ